MQLPAIVLLFLAATANAVVHYVQVGDKNGDTIYTPPNIVSPFTLIEKEDRTLIYLSARQEGRLCDFQVRAEEPQRHSIHLRAPMHTEVRRVQLWLVGTTSKSRLLTSNSVHFHVATLLVPM